VFLRQKSSLRAIFAAANAIQDANATRHSVTTIKTGHLLDIYLFNHEFGCPPVQSLKME
jgi:hypothetical protein